MEITIKEFMLKQPNYPEVAESDKYYIILANRLAKLLDNSRLLVNTPEQVRKDVVLAVVGYYQDIVADAGIWRSFSTMCKELYGTPLPIYDIPDDYIESELNEVDVKFVVWYVLEMSQESNGTLSPFNSMVERVAHLFFSVLDAAYDDAPMPVELQLALDVDLHDEAEAQRIYDLSYWLFWDSYFLRPAAKEALRDAMERAHDIIRTNKDEEEAHRLLAQLNRDVMVESVTGPLSLSIGEWIKLIVEGKIPVLDEPESEKPHKYYEAMLAATGGRRIAFFDSYDALENFLSDEMGWGRAAEGHLPSLREFDNFVVLANPIKGILIAHDVAQYIAHPDNPLYDAAIAAAEAHLLATEPGRVPIDLLKYLFTNNLLPDARLPHDATGTLLHKNWDFFARLYLQQFYRAR